MFEKGYRSVITKVTTLIILLLCPLVSLTLTLYIFQGFFTFSITVSRLNIAGLSHGEHKIAAKSKVPFLSRYRERRKGE